MRKFSQWMLLLAMVCTCAPLVAATTAADFYVGLLRRGTAEVEAGRNEAALTPLRLAAFGLVDSIEHYETAQAYLVVALDRLNRAEPAREAALRIVAAERVERRFASLSLPAPIRTDFSNAARKLLPSTDAAMLLTPPASTPPVRAAETPKPVPPTTTTTTATTDTTTPPRTTTQASATQPKPNPPAPKPPAPKPAQPQVAQPQATQPQATQPQVAQPQPPKVDAPARLAAAERALVAANLAEARKIYRELLDAGGHDHTTWIRIAEGLYRSRDFAGALAAFQRVGNLRSGEEAYRYYVAVALYETGQYERARRELAAALPHIELTPDVQRYRSRIEGAR